MSIPDESVTYTSEQELRQHLTKVRDDAWREMWARIGELQLMTPDPHSGNPLSLTLAALRYRDAWQRIELLHDAHDRVQDDPVAR